jgi:nucleotide-binding universal stress UspA family protein
VAEGHGFEIGRDGPSVVLVGVDGSPTSMRAAAYAAGQARRQRSRLVAVYVASHAPIASLALPEAASHVSDSLDEQGAKLERKFADFGERNGVAAEFRILYGDPYQELCRTADEVRADAVLVGASAQAGHRFVGSLAVRLVRAGRWPVTVVP